jgi:hypothetical protein
MTQKLENNPIARSPTLETVLMVEKTIEENSGEFNRTELWKALPKKVMWQTFLVIIDYLESLNKILTEPKEQKIIWIWNPQLIRKLQESGMLK